jgi:cobyric acid synthase
MQILFNNIDIIYIKDNNNIIGKVDLTMNQLKGKIFHNKIFRRKLCDSLVDAWREAENYYLETRNGSLKNTVKNIQDACNLSDFEESYVYFCGNSLGI